MVTAERLRYLFSYREDGNLIWKNKNDNARSINIGDIAGTISNEGYIVISVDGRRYKAHRLVFLYHNGYLPLQVDHEDRDPSNNRIKNLRPANQSQNKANSAAYSNNTTGFKGVSPSGSKKNPYAATIRKGKKIHIGHFPTAKMAHDAYVAKSVELFGEFARPK